MNAPVVIDAAVEMVKDDRCTTPCRFLADTPIADIGAKVKSVCGTEWPAVGPKDCAQLDYQRNCIFATAGYTFKKPAYQAAFGKQPWYKARADFKDTDLAKVATDNVAELKKRAAECRKGDVIADADRKTIDAWLAKLQAGKPELPELVLGDGDASKKEVEEMLVGTKTEFAPKRLRAMRYLDQPQMHEGWASLLKGKTVGKVIEADFSDAGDAKCPEGEECGYGLWLTFVLDDKGKIIGLEQAAAACPAVYLGDALQGEIIRNFNTPAREATQSLAVTAPCHGRVTYRIVEEKAETSYLDELVLVIGDTEVLPLTCGALCANDGMREVLARGQALEVGFEIPAGTTCTGARLRANGHYAPLN